MLTALPSRELTSVYQRGAIFDVRFSRGTSGEAWMKRTHGWHAHMLSEGPPRASRRSTSQTSGSSPDKGPPSCLHHALMALP